MKINQEIQESIQIDVILAMAGLQHPRWASAPGPEAEVMLGAWYTARAGLALARALASELGFSLRARGSGHVLALARALASEPGFSLSARG